ncbi:putative ribonuclease H-like domain-containing protein [Tanacetum coccineum]
MEQSRSTGRLVAQGFEDPEFIDRVYKVEKALYGLHQAPRAWYETLSTYLLDNGFQRGQIDKTLFIKRVKGDILLVQVYVDDIIFGSTRNEMCTEFEKMMHKKFQMSSMGELTFFLGLQVTQKDDGIFISQDKYVDEILKKFSFSTVKTASTPMETSKPLLKDAEAEDVDVHLYRSMIGSLMYLTSLRPDIMFVVCACARFQVTPKVSHLHVVKRIFRYFKGQSKLGLWYLKDSPFDLEAYSDSDYAGASLDRKSTTGGCQFLRSRLISWQCKKQTIVANSTTEAEYVAAASCCGQVLWIQNQMLDYGYNFMNTKIFIDNESTICIVKNPVFHSKTKHIEIRHHFIRDSNEKKLIQMIKIHTDQNFWATAKAKTVNGEVHIQALVDGKQVIITETSLSLHLNGNFLSIQFCNALVLRLLHGTHLVALWPLLSSLATTKNSPFPSIFFDNMSEELGGGDETEDVESVPIPSNDPLLIEIAKLKEKVKKLKRRSKSRTLGLKRLRKVGRTARIESSKDKVFDEQEVEIEKVVSIAEVTIVSATTTITVDELNMAQTLIKIKAAKSKAVTAATTTTTTAVTRPKARGIVVQEPKLQAELEEEERLARQKEEEDNLISWDNTQAMMEANYKLAQRLQAEEPVDSFVPIDSKVVEGSKSHTEGNKKRTREELESDDSKKQKIDERAEAEVDDKVEMKKLMEIVPDDEVAIDAIPLATNSRRYSSMIRILQNIDREDLETLWKLVKAKHRNTRPEEVYERVLWGDLKEVNIIKKTENQAKMTKLSMEWKRLCKIKANTKNVKVRVNTEESAVKPEPELKNTIGCIFNPSDGL